MWRILPWQNSVNNSNQLSNLSFSTVITHNETVSFLHLERPLESAIRGPYGLKSADNVEMVLVTGAGVQIMGVGLQWSRPLKMFRSVTLCFDP